MSAPPTFSHLRVPATQPEVARVLGIRSFLIETSITPLHSVSIRDRMSPVQSQGQGPNCAAFAATACLEVFVNKVHLSETHLNHQVATKYTNCSAGLPVLETMYTLTKDAGIVKASDLPYDPNVTCLKPFPDLSGKPTFRFEHCNIVAIQLDETVLSVLKEESQGFGTPGISWDRVDNLRRVLNQYRFPIMLDVPVFLNPDGSYACNWEDGPDIAMPSSTHVSSWLELTRSGENGVGWHGVAICGFDDGPRRFQFKNSWGTDWGDKGYGTLPYDYVQKFSRMQVAGWIGPPDGYTSQSTPLL